MPGTSLHSLAHNDRDKPWQMCVTVSHSADEDTEACTVTLCYWSCTDRAWTLAVLTSQLLTHAIFEPIKQVVTVTNRERFINEGHGGQRNGKEVPRPPKGTDRKLERAGGECNRAVLFNL